MKRFLTAALCRLAAATGSSKCKLRTSTINKAMSNRVFICSSPVRVRAGVVYLAERDANLLYTIVILSTQTWQSKNNKDEGKITDANQVKLVLLR